MDKVVGIIYLDAINKRAAQTMKRLEPAVRRKASIGVGYKILSRLGVLRLLTHFGKLPMVMAYPKELQNELAATTTKWEWLHTMELERKGIFDAYGLLEKSSST